MCLYLVGHGTLADFRARVSGDAAFPGPKQDDLSPKPCQPVSQNCAQQQNLKTLDLQAQALHNYPKS